MNEIIRHRRYCINKKKYSYEFFDYLEHTGNGEYINLPYQPNNNTRMVFRYSLPTITEECILFGSRTIGLGFYCEGIGGGTFQRGGAQVTFGGTALYDWYDIVANTPTEWVRKRPGTSTEDQTRTFEDFEFTVPFNMYLFAVNNGDNYDVNPSAGVKLSGIEIYEGTVLIMEMKPARRDDGRTGYYDAINDIFHFSENEYDFNVGNFADEYDYYDYLENTLTGTYNGKQFISTGIVGGSQVKMKIKGQLTQTNRFFLFGSRDLAPVTYKSINVFECRLIASGSAAGLTAFGYADSVAYAYKLGPADISKVYTIETFPDHWTRTDQLGNIDTVAIPEITFSNNSYITLFTLSQNNRYPVSHIDYGRVGECQMWVNNILQRDYQPAVRKWDGKVGMFERVYGVLYQSYTAVPFNKYGNWS